MLIKFELVEPVRLNRSEVVTIVYNYPRCVRHVATSVMVATTDGVARGMGAPSAARGHNRPRRLARLAECAHVRGRLSVVTHCSSERQAVHSCFSSQRAAGLYVIIRTRAVAEPGEAVYDRAAALHHKVSAWIQLHACRALRRIRARPCNV